MFHRPYCELICPGLSAVQQFYILDLGQAGLGEVRPKHTSCCKEHTVTALHATWLDPLERKEGGKKGGGGGGAGKCILTIIFDMLRVSLSLMHTRRFSFCPSHS